MSQAPNENQLRLAASLRRRDFLVAGSVLCLAAPLPLRAQTAGPDLDGFLVLSTLLTGFDTTGQRDTGQRYLDNLLAQPETAAQLGELWQRAGFATTEPPESLTELQLRGIFTDASLQALADSITLQWYSGTYQASDGSTRVATYTAALAWRTLPYRPAGPSTCGGAFGHWADKPAEA